MPHPAARAVGAAAAFGAGAIANYKRSL